MTDTRLIDKAVSDLRALHVRHRASAERMLSMWSRRSELDADARARVLSHFPPVHPIIPDGLNDDDMEMAVDLVNGTGRNRYRLAALGIILRVWPSILRNDLRRRYIVLGVPVAHTVDGYAAVPGPTYTIAWDTLATDMLSRRLAGNRDVWCAVQYALSLVGIMSIRLDEIYQDVTPRTARVLVGAMRFAMAVVDDGGPVTVQKVSGDERPGDPDGSQAVPAGVDGHNVGGRP
jgi:hypothetical protein